MCRSALLAFSAGALPDPCGSPSAFLADTLPEGVRRRRPPEKVHLKCVPGRLRRGFVADLPKGSASIVGRRRVSSCLRRRPPEEFCLHHLPPEDPCLLSSFPSPSPPATRRFQASSSPSTPSASRRVLPPPPTAGGFLSSSPPPSPATGEKVRRSPGEIRLHRRRRPCQTVHVFAAVTGRLTTVHTDQREMKLTFIVITIMMVNKRNNGSHTLMEIHLNKQSSGFSAWCELHHGNCLVRPAVSDLSCVVIKQPDGWLYKLSHPPKSPTCETSWEDETKTVIARSSSNIFKHDERLVQNHTNLSITMKNLTDLYHKRDCIEGFEYAHCSANSSSNLKQEPQLSTVNSTLICISEDVCLKKEIVVIPTIVLLAVSAFIVCGVLYVQKRRRGSSALTASYTPAFEQVKVETL
ncbi:hypothetical protein L3Q82_026099 [Scortum barcoo]|uniref:Uncharacterized protein n=1 Tax=Scortum barcoo TaxID=214431 RepID=A0ACB8WR29_9TELE|nr:hypothetical protein L3Q82_026099 [Scortum barcoo]